MYRTGEQTRSYCNTRWISYRAGGSKIESHQQDQIIKVHEPLWVDGGEKKESSLMYLHGRAKGKGKRNNFGECWWQIALWISIQGLWNLSRLLVDLFFKGFRKKRAQFYKPDEEEESRWWYEWERDTARAAWFTCAKTMLCAYTCASLLPRPSNLFWLFEGVWHKVEMFYKIQAYENHVCTTIYQCKCLYWNTICGVVNPTCPDKVFPFQGGTRLTDTTLVSEDSEVLVSAVMFTACGKIMVTSSGADAVACSFGSVINATGAGWEL